MDNGRIAAAVIGGYLLGRTKKMKLAIMVGGALMGKKIPTDPTQLLKLAGSLVEKSPELQRLDTAVRGRLMEAGKDAAMSVATSRMETFTDALVDRVENLGKPPADAQSGAEGGGEPEDVEDGEFEDLEDGDDRAEDVEDEAPSAGRGSAARTGSARQNGSAARSGSARQNGSAARQNGSATRNGPGPRSGSGTRNGSGRSTRRTETVHD